MVEQRGIEPLTSALRTRRSAKLSYCPTRVVILGSVLCGVKRLEPREALSQPGVTARRQDQIQIFKNPDFKAPINTPSRVRARPRVLRRSCRRPALVRVCRRRGRQAFRTLRA